MSVKLLRRYPEPIKKMLRLTARKLLPPTLLARLRLARLDFRQTPPILVYQMAKVGSLTVYASLRAAGLRNPIYHVHFLSEGGIRRAEGRYAAAGLPLPNYLKLNRALRSKILSVGGSFEWNVVTMVREPIARYVSSVFQIVESRLREFIGEDGRISVCKMLGSLAGYYDNYDEAADAATTWFADELEHMTGVNVYDYPFDRERGYSCIRAAKARVLVIRLESLGSCFQEAMGAFFDRPVSIPLLDKNMGEMKWYRDEYLQVTKRLRVPREVCERIYESAYSRHFYNEEMRRAFMRRWCEGQR